MDFLVLLTMLYYLADGQVPYHPDPNVRLAAVSRLAAARWSLTICWQHFDIAILTGCPKSRWGTLPV